MLKILSSPMQMANNISKIKRLFYYFLLLAFPATILIFLKYIYLIQTEFQYGQSRMDFITTLILILILILGFIKFFSRKYLIGILYFLAASFLAISLSRIVTFEIRKLAGQNYISNNKNVLNQIKLQKKIILFGSRKRERSYFF